MIQNKYSPLIISIAVILTVIGSLISLGLPNALLPTIDRPEISLISSWSGKGAQEIEQTLIAPLEKEMYGLENLVSTESSIYDGIAVTTLIFHSDADMQQIYIEVLSRVNQVPTWPPQVAKPVIINNSSGSGATLASAMIYAKTPKTETQFINAFKTIVEPALSSVSGVAKLDVSNNPLEQRVDIEFDPHSLAMYSLTISQVINKLQDLLDRSGDTLTLGSKDYALLFKGQMPIGELTQLPIFSTEEHIVRLGELATIEQRLSSEWNFASIDGHRAMYFTIQPSKGVNALETINSINHVMKQLNSSKLASSEMVVLLSRDDSKDIRKALKLVYGSLILGIILAAFVLYYFLKSWGVVTLAIISVPVCLAIVMIAMYFGKYSLNVISLAGMALSVGLLLDAAIIVVENILRFKRNGLPTNEAISKGTSEVKGAIISSTISSIVIFLPILMMDTTESQLFEDLAFTISSALMASVVVALILIPTLARFFISNQDAQPSSSSESKWCRRLTLTARNRTLSLISLFIGLPLALAYSYLSMPNLDVLPNPKQNSISTYILFNEPMNTDSVSKLVARPILSRIEAQKQAGTAPDYDVTGMFCNQSNCLLYFYPSEDWDYPAFKQWVESSIVNDFPGTQIFSQQGSLLQYAMPDSRVTQLDIQGGDLNELQLIARKIQSQIQSLHPNASITEGSPLYNQSSRLEFTPKYDNLAYFDISQAELNQQLMALTGGLYLGLFYVDGDTQPFYLKAKKNIHIDQLLQTQVMVPNHGLQPLHQLVDVKMTVGPQSLLRINREVTVSLDLTPPDGIPVGPFINQVQSEVVEIIQSENLSHLNINYRGSADNLSKFLQEFGEMFIISLIILLVLMWLTLKSWKLAIAVLLSMPLAISGGMFNLQLLNIFVNQNLDVVTLIGFIILMGLVINNAILFVSQFDISIKNGLNQQEAIYEAVLLRRRPIYMSTATSIFGMLPLMLSPGEGSEIYRGLAAVIIGGMTFSAFFSLSFMSALMSLKIFNHIPTVDYTNTEYA